MTFRLCLALLLVLPLAGCDSPTPSEPVVEEPTPGPTPEPEAALLRGVAISPAGFPTDYSRLADFFAEVEAMGRGAVMWNGAWRDDAVNGTNAGEPPAAAGAVATASDGGRRFEPVAVFGWRSGETLFVRVPADATNDWRNQAARAAFRDAVRSYAAAHRPKLLFLGNESDFYAAQDPTDYARWVETYNSAYDAIKVASPATLVGPVFNVEHMMGWGSFSGWVTPRPEAFTMHDRARVDVVGLTVYPYLGRATPAEVPATYLDPVFDLIGDLPVAITETGWPAAAPGSAVAWQPGESQQLAYLARLGEILEDRTVLMVNWLFLHPLSAGTPEILSTFGTVSLRNEAGGKRAVYDAFVGFGAGE